MAVSHTDLTGYFDEQLGEIKTVLGITSYNDTITRTLLDYGIAADFNSNDATLNALLLTATNINKLISFALVNLWKYCLHNSSAKYQQSADGASLSRQQMHEMFMKNLKLALADAYPYDDNSQMKIFEVHPTQTPYNYDPLRINR